MSEVVEVQPVSWRVVSLNAPHLKSLCVFEALSRALGCCYNHRLPQVVCCNATIRLPAPRMTRIRGHTTHPLPPGVSPTLHTTLQMGTYLVFHLADWSSVQQCKLVLHGIEQVPSTHPAFQVRFERIDMQQPFATSPISQDSPEISVPNSPEESSENREHFREEREVEREDEGHGEREEREEEGHGEREESERDGEREEEGLEEREEKRVEIRVKERVMFKAEIIPVRVERRAVLREMEREDEREEEREREEKEREEDQKRVKERVDERQEITVGPKRVDKRVDERERRERREEGREESGREEEGGGERGREEEGGEGRRKEGEKTVRQEVRRTEERGERGEREAGGREEREEREKREGREEREEREEREAVRSITVNMEKTEEVVTLLDDEEDCLSDASDDLYKVIARRITVNITELLSPPPADQILVLLLRPDSPPNPHHTSLAWQFQSACIKVLQTSDRCMARSGGCGTLKKALTRTKPLYFSKNGNVHRL